MGQRGFWDEQRRVSKLQDRKPVLRRLADSIPWESFRPLLERGYTQDRKSNAGRKRIDPLILFKMLVLQQLFNLSDEELEFQVNDRRSFEGLQVWSTSQEWDLEYMAHLEGRGDVPWQPSGSFIGSRGERRRLEGLAFRLTKGVGSFDVLYKAHIAGIGDSSWFKNGEFIGTRGQRRAIEAIEIAVVPVGAVATSGQSFSLDLT